MLTLPIEKATIRTVKDHQYHVFSAPHPHENYKDRPTVYANEKILQTYKGKGSNGSAKLHPDVLAPANEFMSALLEYGDSINDWSIRSAVIASGYRPDDPTQGKNYLRIIKETIASHPAIFGTVKFPEDLEQEAQGVLGHLGDPRRTAFHKKVATAPDWNGSLEAQLFKIVDNIYAPRGSNPHATGFVFDLDFMIYDEHSHSEIKLGANPSHNSAALRNATGLWLNTFSLQLGFDSYNTGIEIWHMEYRRHKSS